MNVLCYARQLEEKPAMINTCLDVCMFVLGVVEEGPRGRKRGLVHTYNKCELCSSPCLSYNRCSVSKTTFWTLGSWPEFLKRTLLWVCLCPQPSTWPPPAWPEDSGDPVLSLPLSAQGPCGLMVFPGSQGDAPQAQAAVAGFSEQLCLVN